MCVYDYCNLGKGVIILGRHVDTEKRDSISQVYHETVRTLMTMIILPTAEALRHEPGRL